VKEWWYRLSWIWYFDGFTGKEKKYLCSFKIEYHDGHIEHVEVKPLNKQFFSDKYLYAQNQLQGWRWITNEEILLLPKVHLPKLKRKKSQHRKIELVLNQVLEMIKQDLTAKQVAVNQGVDRRTIIKFLEDNSYVIKWGKQNEIRYATKLIWPLSEKGE
jgi:hypothetical protein